MGRSKSPNRKYAEMMVEKSEKNQNPGSLRGRVGILEVLWERDYILKTRQRQLPICTLGRHDVLNR